MTALHGPLATSEGYRLFSTDALWVCLQVHHSGASEGTWCIATNSFARSIMIFNTLMWPSIHIGAVFKSVQRFPSTIHKMQLWTARKILAGKVRLIRTVSLNSSFLAYIAR